MKGRERAIVSQTNVGTVSRATLGKLVKDGLERIWTFPSTYLELNWTASNENLSLESFKFHTQKLELDK